MRRVRARWVLGSSLWFGALALSCGGGGTENLFTQPSAHGGGSSAGASSEAGSTPVGSGGVSGSNASGSGAGGAAHAGSNSQAGSAMGGSANGGAAMGGAATGGSPAGGAPGAGAPNGGTSGSAGTGGSPGGSGGTSGNGGSAGNGACVDNSGCANDEYCAKASCAAKAEGHCTKSPAECGNTKAAVVCGCDGVTYHDACLLHQARQNASVLDSGACAKAAEGTVTCTQSNAAECTTHGGVCGFKVENACLATVPDFVGTCWVLPASCPGSDPSSALVCMGIDTNCTSECSAIKGGQRYAMSEKCN